MKKANNSLYWKISATLLLLLVVLGIGYVSISGYIANRYYQESVQRVHANLAESATKEVKPFIEGKINKPAIMDYMHSAMVMNPIAELYLLDPTGNILTHAAPSKATVKLEKVDLKPIKTFIDAKEKPFIIGDDPRHPGTCKIFSAAPIMEEDELKGYVYIILQSDKEAELTSGILGSYMLELGANLFFLTLIGALVIGLLAIWFLTKRLRNITRQVQRFKEGDYKARICKEDRRDFPVLADTYNSMADTIVANIDELKSVEILRRELIANVSHDLRTPLAIVQGYVETLLIKEDNISKEDRKKYLETSMSSLGRLQNLIAQLFEYSKLEAKQIEPNKEPFFISELAQDVAAKYQILAQEKGIKIHLEEKENLPLVFADVGLVERVIQNLMDNALNHTPKGGEVTIDLGLINNNVEIKIKDTGIGIPEEEQSFIFERYRQASRTGEKAKGAGLGLAIVQKILELHDTTIEVKSKINEGTAFMFQLPSYSQA
jgi:signal transduction histidine kinase